MTDRLLRRLRDMDWPAPLQDRPLPAAGQLWRIAREGAAGLRSWSPRRRPLKSRPSR